jgi:hypothetical protein
MENEFVISSGTKKITIKDESGEVRGVISFNPTDTTFTEMFYQLIGEFKTKIDELQDRSKELEKDSRVDENGLFLNTGERLAFVRETCVFIREKIDHLFGAGTSQIAFGDTLNLDVFPQFFEGIMPFVKEARKRVMSKYVDDKSSKVMK